MVAITIWQIASFSSKDLDRVEMALQGEDHHRLTLGARSETIPASEYEDRHTIDLQPFFDSSIPNIAHPEIKSWAADLMAERASRGSGS